MRLSNFKYLFLICCTVLNIIEMEAKIVKLSLYYETLCPECVRLIDAILSTYQELGKYMELDFVPFGKAYMVKNVVGEWFFQCQHGPSECFGNALHACALDQDLRDLDSASFINCSLVDQDISECGYKSGVDMRLLNYCMNTKGASLLAEYGLRTSIDIKKLDHVPFLIFNDKFDPIKDSKGRKDIKNQVCDLLDYKPEPCQIENIVFKNRKRKRMREMQR